jgi:hypothetical protein
MRVSKERFIKLASGFCRLAKLPQPEKLIEGHAVEVDGVDFYLAYDEENSPDHVMVYCDFGTPPQDRLLAAYQALLEANMIVYGSNAPAFMLSPSKKVTLAYQYRVDEVVPEQLMGLFANLSGQAGAWRSHYFLDAAA